jgi:low affinity Fe/Cu permease
VATDREEPARSGSRGFARLAALASNAAGRPTTFGLAVLLLLVWALSGPIFGFSDTWQLIINTTTTIITFLMVFLIQNTQSRDTAAMQIKLDELIRVTARARNAFMALEDLDEPELERLRKELRALAGHDVSLEGPGEAPPPAPSSPTRKSQG